MARKLIIILILLLMGGCITADGEKPTLLKTIMPDQFSISTFEGPMGQRIYIPGLIWNIPQPK